MIMKFYFDLINILNKMCFENVSSLKQVPFNVLLFWQEWWIFLFFCIWHCFDTKLYFIHGHMRCVCV